jgi:hypothetical protein
MDPTEVKKLSWLGARMREPSTYFGLGALLLAIHTKDASSVADAVTKIGEGLGGLLLVVTAEGK